MLKPKKDTIKSVFILSVIFSCLIIVILYIALLILPSFATPKKTSFITDLFEYGPPIENSRLGSTEVAAWNVKVHKELLLDRNKRKIRFNMMDGTNYEVIRTDERMQGFCDIGLKIYNQCTWIGQVVNQKTDELYKGSEIILIINDKNVIGTIPAVVGINRFIYSLGGKPDTSWQILFKVDPRKFGPD